MPLTAATAYTCSWAQFMRVEEFREDDSEIARQSKQAEELVLIAFSKIVRAWYRCESFVSALLFHSWPQIVERVAVHCQVHQAAMQEGGRYKPPVLPSRDQAIHLHNVMLLSATNSSIPKVSAHKNISRKCNDAVALYNYMVFASRGTVHWHTLAPHIMRPPLLRICTHGTANSVHIVL